jgi:hypothetical protein
MELTGSDMGMGRYQWCIFFLCGFGESTVEKSNNLADKKGTFSICVGLKLSGW